MGGGSAEKDLESSAGGGGDRGRNRLLTWATLNSQGLGWRRPGQRVSGVHSAA